MNRFLIFRIFVYTQLIVNGRYIEHDRLESNYQLNHDNCLVSSDKRFYLCMQNDGNLVIYKGANTRDRLVIWSSKTNGKGSFPHRLIMQLDGNLVIYDSKNHPTWASGTHDRGAVNAYMIMQSDGNLVIYNRKPHSPIWATNTHGPSDIDCKKSETWPHDWTKFEDEVILLVNQVRSQGAFCNGHWRPPLPSIRQNGRLTRAARCHTVDMVIHGYFAHTDPQGGTLRKRINEVNSHFSKIAENIAKGQTTPQEVVKSWMDSPGHCYHIMNDYEEIGIGYIGVNNYPDSRIWVQNFGTSM